MNRARVIWFVLAGLGLVLGGAVGWKWYAQSGAEAAAEAADELPVPVETAAIERGPIEDRRTFSGTLEATAEFAVAPKIDGRISRLAVRLADPVENGQVVIELDREVPEQLLAQSEANLEVARAGVEEAESLLEIAELTMSRLTELRGRGGTTELEVETAASERAVAVARRAVARAEVRRAEAQAAAARLQLEDTRIRASWRSGNDTRVVSAELAEEGETVEASTPVLQIVELDPIRGVFFVAERDYARLRIGQPVSLQTDAYPGVDFAGEISRVAPVFEADSRQARVEVRADNADRRLKPGMFVRARAVLDRIETATTVPVEALVRRDDRPAVFVVDEAAGVARLQPVETGVVDRGRVQITGEDLAGSVVTLGQQLLKDGSAIRVDDGDRP